MSAAFALDFSGDPVPKPKPVAWSYDRHCVVCGVPFTVLGAEKKQIFDTCGSEQCLLHYARHHAAALPVVCNCAQRPYPHEIGVHAKRSEQPGVYLDYYDQPIRFAEPGMRWPWSLRFAPNMEAPE